jgi:hypothetical protein
VDCRIRGRVTARHRGGRRLDYGDCASAARAEWEANKTIVNHIADLGLWPIVMTTFLALSVVTAAFDHLRRR